MIRNFRQLRDKLAPTPPRLFPKGMAVLLNSTFTSYHWGCYATSGYILNRLQDAGFFVDAYPAEVSHFGLPGPSLETPVDFDRYAEALKARNPGLFFALQDADIVVANGEGTIHRSHGGPVSLLAVLAYAKKALKKPTHLINHSCFPNGDINEAPAEVEAYYRFCLEDLDSVVARDPWSVQIYRRLGIAAVQGFDCLPAFARKYYRPAVSRPARTDAIGVSCASHWKDGDVGRFAGRLETLSADSRGPLRFIGGGFRRSPPEDVPHYEALQRHFGAIEHVKPPSADAWLDSIASLSLLVTGRFHHVIGALCVGTPVIAFPGNTPKVDAVASMFSDIRMMDLDDAGNDRIRSSWRRDDSVSARMNDLADMAEKNFGFLD